MQHMRQAPYATRWLDHNKGDASKPEYRSRHVVQETCRTSTIPKDDVAATTSSTPPLEVVRLFCGFAMSLAGVVLQFLDISRAHPHCTALRENMYIEAPKELGLDPSQCLRLKKCWYGTRDAGQAFEFAVRGDVEANDFSQGVYSPCVYPHKTRRLWYFVHGDDYVGLWTWSGTDSKPAQRFIMKLRVPETCSTPPTRNADPEPCAHVEVIRGRTRRDDPKQTHDTSTFCFVIAGEPM